MVNTSGIASSLKRRISAETIVLTSLAVLIILGLYLTSLYNYLLFHGIVKCACIGIAITIYVIIWNTRRHVVDTFLLIVAVSFLFSGFFELLHMLTFNGIHVFPGNTENLTDQIWIAGRYFQSVTLCLAVFFFGKTLTKDQKDDFTIFVTLGAVITLGLLGSIFLWQIFPACFIPGVGRTLFMIASESIIALILFAAIVLLLMRRTSFDREVWQFLTIALVFLAASELAFTIFANEYSFMNTTGHVFTLVSYYFFYRAIVVVAVRRPADLVFRQLKEDEEALQESESRYRAFFSTSLDGVYMTSREGKLLDFNNALLGILGYSSREELVNIDVGTLYAESSVRDQYTREIDKVGYVREFSVRVKKKDGTIIDCLASSLPLHNRNGETIGYHGTIRDVTFRNRAEAAIRESEERYRTLFEESPVAIWEEDFSDVKSWIDAKSREGITDWTAYFKEHPEDLRRCASLVRIVHFNHATTMLYGITTVLELTAGLSGIFTDESYESFREELVCFAEKKYICESERPLQTLNGKRIVTLIRAAVVPGFEATLAKVLVTVIDITKLKKAEATLRESEERFRTLFEESPLAMREEDFSDVKSWIDAKSGEGITDWEAYFKDHPEDLRRCASLVKVV
ncbi:MAG: MASE3 domain-containing protein, partial [Methanoregula sp.]